MQGTQRAMQSLLVSGMCGLVCVLGCKAKDKEAPPPPTLTTDPVGSNGSAGSNGGAGTQLGSAATTTTRIALGSGETYFGGKESATNLVNWKLDDGSIVQLVIVTTGKSKEGWDEGTLRAYSQASPSYDVGPRYSLDSSKNHWAELTAVPNNRMLFRYGADGEGRYARNAVLLRWDEGSKRVVVAKRWFGATADAEPAWLTTGKYVAETAPDGESNCLKVIARMVQCEKDEAFRRSLWARAKDEERPAMQAHLDTHVAKWKSGSEAKAQCVRWASDDYVDSHFAEPRKLANLAKEASLGCGPFGAEIVDEGGLPVALTDAAKH